MEIKYLNIQAYDDETYIVNNTINNKYVKLGQRELNYLLKVNKEQPLEGNKGGLTQEQEQILYERFKQMGLLVYENHVIHKKKNLTDIEILSFNTDKKFKFILEKLQYLISPIGGICVILSILITSYLVMFNILDIIEPLKNFKVEGDKLLILYVLIIINASIHEMCHAAACYKYVGQVGKMGIKLFYLFPAFFCDVSPIYMVKDKNKSLVVAGAGLCANSIIGMFALLIYIVFYKFGIEMPVLVYFFIINISIIIYNLNPLAKFDGYWIIRSFIETDNLYDKSIGMFFKLIFNFKAYKKIVLESNKNIFMTAYGASCFLFHWIFWLYTIYVIDVLLKRIVIGRVNTILVLALGIVVFYNCITYTYRYYKKYKKSGW